MATTLGNTSLAGALNQDAYNAYLADAISQGQMPQDYQAWRDSYLRSWNVPTDADLNQYNITTTSSDGSQWGGQLGQQVTKQGEASPVFQDSWANGGRWDAGELALLTAAMFGGGALLSGAMGGTAGVAAAEGAGGLGSLGAADAGVTALGSAWSPSALGLTGSIAPGVTATEIAALGSGIPGALGGGLAGAGGVSSLGAGMSPASLGITPVAPAVGAADMASALGAAQGLPGAVSAPLASIGGSGGLSSADKAAIYGNAGYGPGMTGAQTSAYDSVLGATGSKGAADMVANSSLGSNLINGVKGAADLVGGGSNLAALIGAVGGAASGGGTETSSRDPWAAAQPYLKNILADAEKMRANLAANPFTPQQTQAYSNAYAGLDQARSALPGLLSWGQGAMQRQSTTPSYDQLFGGGLLAQQPQQPTAQAGGSGGLLGNQDRMKALMARGHGLIG